MEKITLQIEKKDGGYYFPQFGIHVAAKSETAAKKIIEDGHGINIAEAIERLNNPPTPEDSAEEQESE